MILLSPLILTYSLSGNVGETSAVHEIGRSVVGQHGEGSSGYDASEQQKTSGWRQATGVVGGCTVE